MGILEKMALTGKKGFVTGAARGIGKCTATAFAEAGADVAIVDLDIETAKKTAAELAEKTGRKVIAIQTDCTSKEQVDAMVEEVVAKLGGLDFCHNNAGICINAPAEEMRYEQWLKVININLNGIFLTDIAAGKYMLATAAAPSSTRLRCRLTSSMCHSRSALTMPRRRVSSSSRNP